MSCHKKKHEDHCKPRKKKHCHPHHHRHHCHGGPKWGGHGPGPVHFPPHGNPPPRQQQP